MKSNFTNLLVLLEGAANRPNKGNLDGNVFGHSDFNNDQHTWFLIKVTSHGSWNKCWCGSVLVNRVGINGSLLGWEFLNLVVAWRWVLLTQLFTNNIYDLNCRNKCITSQFTDGTKWNGLLTVRRIQRCTNLYWRDKWMGKEVANGDTRNCRWWNLEQLSKSDRTLLGWLRSQWSNNCWIQWQGGVWGQDPSSDSRPLPHPQFPSFPPLHPPSVHYPLVFLPPLISSAHSISFIWLHDCPTDFTIWSPLLPPPHHLPASVAISTPPSHTWLHP